MCSRPIWAQPLLIGLLEDGSNYLTDLSEGDETMTKLRDALISIGLIAAFISAPVKAQIEAYDVGYQDEAPPEGRLRTRQKQNTGGVIINNSLGANAGAAQNQAQSQAQMQPTTYVEASPLVESRADLMRKARQGAEVQTEQKIVEKLEESRLDDERRRADRLFGNRLETPQTVEVAPVLNEVTVIEPTKVKVKETNVVAENIIVVDDDISRHKPSKNYDYYFGGNLGMIQYSQVENMQGNGALGFSVGTDLGNGFSLEGSFLYSNFYINEFWLINYFKEMDQYNYNFAAKFTPFKSVFKPYVGALVGYTYRSYQDRTPGAFPYVPNEGQISTGTVDFGGILGIDFDIADNFAIGGEYRYSRNLINTSEYDFLMRSDLRQPQYTTPIEELSYSTFTVNGKFTF